MDEADDLCRSKDVMTPTRTPKVILAASCDASPLGCYDVRGVTGLEAAPRMVPR